MPEQDFRPSWAIAPAESLRRALIRKGWSPADLAAAMAVSPRVAEALVDGSLSIDSTHSSKLAIALDTSEDFWLNRQQRYSASAKAAAPTTDEKAWLRELPLRDMTKFGWIEPVNDERSKLASALAFFDVETLSAWQDRYRPYLAAAAFRTSLTFTSNPLATTAWLRRAETEAENIDCGQWNVAAFRSALTEARKLTRRKRPSQFITQLQRLCASCGVAVVIVRAPEGCRASGATRFLSPTKAMIVMSISAFGYGCTIGQI